MRIATYLLSLVLALYVGMMASTVGTKDGFLLNENRQPAVTDYLSLWGAGRLALQGKAPAAYDWEKHDAAQEQGLGRPLPNLAPIAYPPTFLLIMAPFASLDYLPSYLVFGLATLLAYGAVNAMILGRAVGALWMSATFATVVCFWLGQNGLMNAALLGAGLVLVPTRPILAGVALGLLSYKPHMGLLIPFALAAAGLWRVLASAVATALAFALTAVVVLGFDAWIAAFDGMARFADFMLHTYPTPARLQTVFGLTRTLGAPNSVALFIQGALAVAVLAVVVVVWRSAAPYRLKAALLAACVVMPSPYLFVYDMTVLTIAQAFLLAHVLPAEPERPEIYALVGTNLLVALAIGYAFPFATFAAPLLVGVALWRMWPEIAPRRERHLMLPTSPAA